MDSLPQERHDTRPQFPSAASTYYYPAEPEISFMELWNILLRHYKLIIGVTALATAAAVAYALLLPSIYQVTIKLWPPSQQSLYSLSVKDLQTINPETVFQIFQRNLGSAALQWEFIQQENLINELMPAVSLKTTNPDQFSQIFSMLISVNKQEEDKAIAFSLRGRNPTRVAQMANNYMQFIDKTTIQALVSSTTSLITTSINQLEAELAGKQDSAKKLITQEIARLTDILPIATSLKGRKSVQIITQNGKITTQDEKIPEPLYDFEYDPEILKIKIDTLQKRRAMSEALVLDVTHTQNLNLIREKITFLKAASALIKPETLHSAIVDQPAYPPTSRYKPNRRLIVSVGSAFGLIAGVFVAFLLNFVSTARKQTRYNEV